MNIKKVLSVALLLFTGTLACGGTPVNPLDTPFDAMSCATRIVNEMTGFTGANLDSNGIKCLSTDLAARWKYSHTLDDRSTHKLTPALINARYLGRMTDGAYFFNATIKNSSNNVKILIYAFHQPAHREYVNSFLGGTMETIPARDWISDYVTFTCENGCRAGSKVPSGCSNTINEGISNYLADSAPMGVWDCVAPSLQSIWRNKHIDSDNAIWKASRIPPILLSGDFIGASPDGGLVYKATYLPIDWTQTRFGRTIIYLDSSSRASEVLRSPCSLWCFSG